MRKDISTNDKDINDLFLKVVDLITQAREHVATAVNIAEVYTKFHIGQYIVEYEQKGETRAEYGKAVLKELSKRLTDRLGDGWSYSTLKNIRQFYIVFSKGLTGGCPKFSQKANRRLADYSKAEEHLSEPTFTLSWSHYLILMRVENPDARRFYEIECTQQQWSKRQLSRQIGSCLTHQDLGQMQMYVNYYDRYVKQDFEKPTIGILLCKEKNDALVELTLPKDVNIYASAYQLYLPNKALLQAKVKEWIEEFEENEELKKLEEN